MITGKTIALTRWTFVGKVMSLLSRLVITCLPRSKHLLISWLQSPSDLLELTSKKDVLFIIGDWNTKVRSQEIPGLIGKFGLEVQNEAGQRLTEFYQENALLIANTLFQQHKWKLHLDITRWPVLKSDWLYSLQPKMEKLYTVSKNKTGSWLCSDHELFIAKFRWK